jgi:hypothetical protein
VQQPGVIANEVEDFLKRCIYTPEGVRDYLIPAEGRVYLAAYRRKDGALKYDEHGRRLSKTEALEELGSTAINALTFGVGRISEVGLDFPGAFGALVKAGRSATDTVDAFSGSGAIVRTATNARTWYYLMAGATTGPTVALTVGLHPSGQLLP